MPLAENQRLITLKTPLGKDALLLDRFVGREQMSQPFQFELTLLSENSSASFGGIVGKSVTISIETADSPRHINGVVSHFSQGVTDKENITVYNAIVVPWFWNLSQTADCRIFQNKTVPDIIKQVFEELGFNDYRVALNGSYPPRVYCVQYRETDFHFISRLMEDEGMFYFFEHTDSKHTMVIGDSPSVSKPVPGQSKFNYDPHSGTEGHSAVMSWRERREVRPAKYSISDYNFETPSNDLKAEAPTMATIGRDDKLTIFDYEGNYLKRPEGERYAKLRIAQQEAAHVEMTGTGDLRTFVPGYTFTLSGHNRQDANADYLITSVEHRAESNLRSNTPGATYANQFTCIPKSVQYLPPRSTPKPVVRGPQTAVVVGKSGEEIWTDKYGRIKVQFHWDREGKRDENSSCWIRVAMPWAGKQWGAVSIPRLGQEVVVDFLEGDPDRPIVMGSVYNAEQMPPYQLPGNAVISGVKTNSTKGGNGYNEFVMDDTKGKELVRLHAQYDHEAKIEHDGRLTVVNDQTIQIEQGNRSLRIKMGNDTTKIDLGQSTTEAMQSIELTVGQSSIKLDQSGVTIKGLMISVEGQVQTEVKGLTTQISGDAMLTVQGGITMIN
jgi:type VI secretion system secreted protein VgrG